MSKYYRVTGLTWLTNGQRIATAAASHWFLTKMARDYTSTETGKIADHRRDDATRWFNELGVSDHGGGHADFAKWLNDHDAMPNVHDLQNDPMRGTYGLAIRRLVDRAIQDPYKADRAIASSQPIVGLMFQLMSFNYQFNRNVLQPTTERIKHSFNRARGETLAASQPKLLPGQTPSALSNLSRQIGGAAAGSFYGGGATLNALASAGAIVASSIMTSTIRQMIFSPDQIQQHKDDGDLGSYLTNLGFSRSGLNGPLDPFVQVLTHLRYNSDLTSLMDGAGPTWFAQNANAILQGFVGPDDGQTNTRLFNAWRGAYNLIGLPIATYGLTALGTVGGPLLRPAASIALQLGSSPGAANYAAELAAGGAKGTKRAPDDSDKDPDTDTGPKDEDTLDADVTDAANRGGSGPGVGEGGTGFGWGLADDVAVPTARYAAPWISRLPGPVKALGVAGAAAYAAKRAYDARAPFVGQEPPPPAHH